MRRARVIGALLLGEAAYQAFTAYFWVSLYLAAAGTSAGMNDFVDRGFATGTLRMSFTALILAVFGAGCLTINLGCLAILDFISPLALLYGIWATASSAPAVMSWSAALQGDQIALGAIAALGYCAIGILGLSTLASRWRRS